MSAHEATTGTLRTAVEALTADIGAAVEKMKTRLAGAQGEPTDTAELLAVTCAQLQLVKAVQRLVRLSEGMLAMTTELREREGIPVTEREIFGGCGCPGCTARLAATPTN